MDPRDLAEEVEEMDVEEDVAVAVVEPMLEPEGPGAVEAMVAGVFEKVAVGVFTAAVQAEVRQWMVSFFHNNSIIWKIVNHNCKRGDNLLENINCQVI